MNTSKCPICSENLLPVTINKQIVQYSMFARIGGKQIPSPPMSMWICIKCGHVSFFVLSIRDGPKKVKAKDVPVEVRRALGIGNKMKDDIGGV